MRGITDAEEKRDRGGRPAGAPRLLAAILAPTLLAATPALAQLRPSDATSGMGGGIGGGIGGMRLSEPAGGADEPAEEAGTPGPDRRGPLSSGLTGAPPQARGPDRRPLPPLSAPLAGSPAAPGEADPAAEAGARTYSLRARSPVLRPGGVGASAQALSILLKRRAAPSRRSTLPTRRVVREIVQVQSSAPRLTPVVQNPVSGVPLPQPLPSPILGLITPGSLLANGLRRPLATDDAYAPLGIKLGTITVLPAFTQSLGYDTNPDQLNGRGAKGSVASRSEAEIAFRSDWSAAELAGELRGSYLEYPQNEAASRPNAVGAVRLRVDVNRDLRLDAEGRFLVDSQRTSSADLQATAATGRPLIASYGATVGATQAYNRLSVSLRGSVDRFTFEDAQLAGGAVLSQRDRNQNQYGLRLRTAYEVSPTISPFVDVLADTRIYDLTRDANGLRRDSDGVGITAGASFALARTVTGEISAGLQHRTYVDPSLRAINAPLLNAAVVWSASPLTTVRLAAVTSVTETTLAGSSGAVTETASLEVQHDLLRNLSITLGGAYLQNTYQGVRINETGFSATARVDYRFTRWLTLRGTYLYQQIDSSVPSASFHDNTFLLGLRVNP